MAPAALPCPAASLATPVPGGSCRSAMPRPSLSIGRGAAPVWRLSAGWLLPLCHPPHRPGSSVTGSSCLPAGLAASLAIERRAALAALSAPPTAWRRSARLQGQGLWQAAGPPPAPQGNPDAGAPAWRRRGTAPRRLFARVEPVSLVCLGCTLPSGACRLGRAHVALQHPVGPSLAASLACEMLAASGGQAA